MGLLEGFGGWGDRIEENVQERTGHAVSPNHESLRQAESAANGAAAKAHFEVHATSNGTWVLFPCGGRRRSQAANCLVFNSPDSLIVVHDGSNSPHPRARG